MPRVTAKAASPRSKRRNAVVPATARPSPPTPVQPSVNPPTTQSQPRKQRIARRRKYHETDSFLERESFKGLAPTDSFLSCDRIATWFPGTAVGEAYRVVTTIFRAAHQAALGTRPVSWGYGHTDGALGHNNTRRAVEIKSLAAFRRAIVRDVSAGNRLSLFLTDDNRILQSGRLFMKQDGSAMWRPVEILMDETDLSTERPRFVAVEAGHLAAYALDDHGRVYSWGSQVFGQLGHGEELEGPESIGDDHGDEDLAGTVVDMTKFEDGDEDETDEVDEDADEDAERPPKVVVVEKSPRLVEALAGHAIVKISSGNHFVVAISSAGAVFSWGRGCFGQLGNGGMADVSTPAQVKALVKYVPVDIAAGMNHALGVFVAREESSRSNQQDGQEPFHPHQYERAAVTERSVVLVWGRGQHGCLGLGGSTDELLPSENVFFRGLGATKVAAGADHSLVLCGVGSQTFLYAFGGNRLGQLGVASPADHVDMPTFLDEFVNVNVVTIGAGSQHSAALTGDGEVFTWGDARYGKTCRSDGRTSFVPWRIDMASRVPRSSFITQLSVGAHHTLAQLRILGEVDRWRKFSMGPIAAALSDEGHSSKVSVCRCKSSQSTTKSVLGVFVQCKTCGVAPLCGKCCRRCHEGHSLLPMAIGRGVERACKCSEVGSTSAAPCIFAARLPPAVAE